MPLLAPVTITLRPVRSGMSVVLKVVMDNNVDTANNAVNDNFVRRAPRTAAYVAVRAAVAVAGVVAGDDVGRFAVRPQVDPEPAVEERPRARHVGAGGRGAADLDAGVGVAGDHVPRARRRPPDRRVGGAAGHEHAG